MSLYKTRGEAKFLQLTRSQWYPLARIMKFTIPIVEKISNNKLRTVHWGTRASITKKYIKEVKKQLTADMWIYESAKGLRLIATFYFKNRPLDCSNCAGMCKMIEDALVEAKAIKDDSPEYIKSVTLISKVDKENPRITIELK